MGETKIFVTKDKVLAMKTAKAWLIENPDYQGAVVAGTGSISLEDAAKPFDPPKWQADSAGPWYLVLATQDSFATGNGPAAGMAGKAEEA